MSARSETVSANLSATPGGAREPNFYLLPFASQMIVWAMRKSLSAVPETRGGNHSKQSDQVMNVFSMADWNELYLDLLAAFEIIAGTEQANDLPRHAIGCPCIAPHEAHFLNAVAHLRYGRRDEAILSLCSMLPPSKARLILPHSAAVATQLSDAGLLLAIVNTSRPGRSRQHTAAPGGSVH